MTCTDPIKLIADISVAITTPGRHLCVFRESPELRQLRRHILHMPAGDDRKMQWKALAKQRRAEHRQWQTEQLTWAGKQWWQSKRAVDNEKHDNAWELRLRGDERWRETLQKHFGGIFHKGDITVVARRMEAIRHRITRRCKDFPWTPFSEEELKTVRKRWKNSKACGPDSISHEALKVLEQDDRWRAMLLYVFNDMLYTAAIPDLHREGDHGLAGENDSTGGLERHETDHPQLHAPPVLLSVDHWESLASPPGGLASAMVAEIPAGCGAYPHTSPPMSCSTRLGTPYVPGEVRHQKGLRLHLSGSHGGADRRGREHQGGDAVGSQSVDIPCARQRGGDRLQGGTFPTPAIGTGYDRAPPTAQ